MTTPDANCPRCGAALQRRLADRECAACGYFKLGRHRATEGLADGTPQGSLSRLVTSVDTPGEASGIGGPISRFDAVPSTSQSVTRLKQAFLIAFGILFIAGNVIVLKIALGGVLSIPVTLGVLGGSVLTIVLMAVALFIDWPAAKFWAAMLALFFIVADCYSCYYTWDKLDALAKGKHVVDALFLVAFAAICLWEWRYENNPSL